MANWQSIDELQDIATDLPRFIHALDELSRRLGLDITRWLPITYPCAAIKTPPLNAGVAGLNSAVNSCQKI